MQRTTARSGGRNTIPADVPPAWKPRRAFHYRNLCIFGSFLACALVLIVVGAVTIPKDPHDSGAQEITSPPTSSRASTNVPVPVSTLASTQRANPDAFFGLSIANETACTSPPKDRKAWLRSTLDTLLSFGTRVAGSGSAGFSNSHHMITKLAKCDLSGDGSGANRKYWSLWHDNFTTSTPLGQKSFSNIVAEMNQPPRNADGSRPLSAYGSKGHLLVSAHFDSKLSTSFEFLGACDSASPVTMMLLLMRELAATYRSAGVDASVYDSSRPSYTFVFFDGEEAFVDWTGTDNTYGSRHLASQYASNGDIDSIDIFLLLDLLGPARPTFHNYFFAETGTHYQRLRAIEQRRLTGGQRFTASAAAYFPNEASYPSRIEDDHIPWFNRGVPVLHMIPAPFPPAWHTAGDDGSSIDDDTAAELFEIVLEYARDFDATSTGGGRRKSGRRRQQQQRKK
jgi:glutaminyl-peptide cyclotransferase